MSTDLESGTRPDVNGEALEAPAGVTATDGGGNGQPDPQPDGQDEIIRLRAENAAYERLLQRYGAAEPDAGNHSPTPDDGRAQELEQDTQILEAEIASLAKSRDPLARMLIAEKQARLKERQMYGHAIGALNEKIEIAALPRDQQAPFKAWLKSNRSRFADFDAAQLAWEGEQARNRPAGGTPPKPLPAAPAGRPTLVTDVEAHVRRVPAREAAERVMTDEQYDDAVSELHRTGDHEGARQMAAQYADGRIVVKPSK